MLLIFSKQLPFNDSNNYQYHALINKISNSLFNITTNIDLFEDEKNHFFNFTIYISIVIILFMIYKFIKSS